MIVSYIRPDKDFDGVYEQLKLVNSYSDQKMMKIHEELVDQTSQNKRLSERDEVVRFFRSLNGDTLIIYDTWTLSSNIEDLVQMFSCLLKNGNTLHFVKQGVVIDRKSDTMVVLGLIDQLRQILQDDAKKGIGRPRGSKSSSKFDIYLDEIIGLLKQGKSVSEIARILNVSRSSLKDYIESRELKEVVSGVIGVGNDIDAEAMVIGTIRCPNNEINSKEA
ncbi:MAG: helix-turn-helix domain-containing protein [Sulfuricurvum sp.]|nr:helix-turn-helix domain-containing protein [Sulfuricurvum sp.]